MQDFYLFATDTQKQYFIYEKVVDGLRYLFITDIRLLNKHKNLFDLLT